MLRASWTGTDILGTEKGGRAGCRCLYRKGGDPKVKDRLKGYLSFFIMPGKSRRVRVMDFFWGGGEDNTDN